MKPRRICLLPPSLKTKVFNEGIGASGYILSKSIIFSLIPIGLRGVGLIDVCNFHMVLSSAGKGSSLVSAVSDTIPYFPPLQL